MTQPSQKIWFVTGASRGLGAQIVDAALVAGDIVVATGRNTAQLQARFANAGSSFLALALDVRDAQSCAAAVTQATERFGRIDVLVNNAGFGLLGAVEEASDAEVRAQFETNVFGLLNVTRAALPAMRTQRAGHVINVSSIGGFQARTGFGIYCATKFAVEGLTEALHEELTPLGIHVTVVEPGGFRTDFLDASSLQSSESIADYAGTAGRSREVALQANGRQPGDPVRLAQALIRLANDQNPPLRIAFGSDALEKVKRKLDFVAAETARWKDLSASTSFPS